jgi:hypothetical protein
MARRLALSVLTIPLSLAGGCFYAPPTFEVVDVRLTERSGEAYVLVFTLEGTNTNLEPLPLEEVRYSLSLNGTRVFSGRRTPQATLPPEGAQRVELPASVRLAKGPAPEGEADYRLAGSMTYQIPGSIAEILFDTSIRRPSVGFGESGSMRFEGGLANDDADADAPTEPPPPAGE